MSGSSRHDYRRGRPRLEPEPAVLIVTEGSRTEPRYFEGLRDALRLGATQVEVRSADGTDPAGIINYAVKRRNARRGEARRGEGVEYEDVWTVFDSEHRAGSAELGRALDLAQREGVRVAMSAPCFEYWFILHFEYTTQYMCSYAEAARRLKCHVADYDKSAPPIDTLLTRLPMAIQNASRCRTAQDEAGAELPRTDVDLLALRLNRAAREHNRIVDVDSYLGQGYGGSRQGDSGDRASGELDWGSPTGREVW